MALWYTHSVDLLFVSLLAVNPLNISLLTVGPQYIILLAVDHLYVSLLAVEPQYTILAVNPQYISLFAVDHLYISLLGVNTLYINLLGVNPLYMSFAVDSLQMSSSNWPGIYKSSGCQLPICKSVNPLHVFWQLTSYIQVFWLSSVNPQYTRLFAVDHLYIHH